MNPTLIIPSAKLVPEELQKVGKFPGVIYPVNQKIVFDYLYEQYKNVCKDIQVICYEAADKVHRRLRSYEGRKVNIIDLNELQDLGYTIYSAIQDIDSPIIINFSDTIVFDNIFEVEKDAFYYSEDFATDIWTFYDIKDGIISNIYDKIDWKNKEKRKLFVGVFQILNTNYFKKCLKKAFQNNDEIINYFYYAIMEYSKMYPFEDIKTTNWFDIGHPDTYYNSKLEVKAREFNHITIDKNRGILRKSSDDKDKFIGEILWYLKLPKNIEYVRPRIFSYSTQYNNPYVEMEYYAYHTLHELALYGDLNKHQWVDVFKRICFVCEDFKKYTVKNEFIRNSLEDMYLNKTVQRFDRMRKDERFIKFFGQPITVNGKKYKCLNSVQEELQRVVPKMLFDVDEFSVIHGDLCFANIMVDENYSFIKVIDPRGKFGNFDIYGDFRYELAKLFHSVDGKYDFIIKDLFKINYKSEENEVNYSIINRVRTFDLYQTFLEVFKEAIGNDLKKIELIEALLFLTMIPLHNESFEHQLVMLGTGLEILNRVINVEEI